MLTIKQVLEQFPICRATLYARMKDGTFPKPHKIGKRLLWNERDIDIFARTGIADFSKLSKTERRDILGDIERLFTEDKRDATWGGPENLLTYKKFPMKSAFNQIKIDLGLDKSAAPGQVYSRFLDLLCNHQNLCQWVSEACGYFDKLRANTVVELVGKRMIPRLAEDVFPGITKQLKADIK